MNRLSTAQRVAVVKALVEGNSIRSTVRMTGVAKNTVAKLLVELGAAVRDVPGRDARATCSASAFSATKFGRSSTRRTRTSPARRSLKRNPDAGDVWTWTAIDADTKLCVSWLVGDA